MKIISSAIRSDTVCGAIDEINRNDDMMDVAAAYSQHKKIGMADAIEAIASHIVYTDEDFEF
ncbi:MAG TPA: hypothetical protein VLH56_08785 [Dissulfurispiraceae bacterium]|nr:hypothetical protein [Dissulfurispiraceae bacterium]